MVTPKKTKYNFTRGGKYVMYKTEDLQFLFT